MPAYKDVQRESILLYAETPMITVLAQVENLIALGITKEGRRTQRALAKEPAEETATQELVH
jgi:hypothetical protein